MAKFNFILKHDSWALSMKNGGVYSNMEGPEIIKLSEVSQVKTNII